MKCPQCGYQNKPDASSCNLCRSVLKKERSESRTQTQAHPKPSSSPGKKKHILVRAGAPTLELEPGKPFTIGRQATCSLPIPSNRVSRLHAEIQWQGELPVLVDKGSSNGTFVGGKPVKEHALASGDELEIGPFHCVYRYEDPDAPLPGSSDDPMEGTATIATGGDFLSGRIGEDGLAEVIQGIEFNQKTGTLDVYGKELRGWIAVKCGVPLAAEAGGLRDEDAVFRVLELKNGRFTFYPELTVHERRMKLTITGLLLEAGRRADETNMGKTHSDEITGA